MSKLIDRKVIRNDLNVIYIPATRLATENNCPTLANMIIGGKLMQVMGEYDEAVIESTLQKVISAKRADMLEINKKAMKIGAEF